MKADAYRMKPVHVETDVTCVTSTPAQVLADLRQRVQSLELQTPRRSYKTSTSLKNFSSPSASTSPASSPYSSPIATPPALKSPQRTALPDNLFATNEVPLFSVTKLQPPYLSPRKMSFTFPDHCTASEYGTKRKKSQKDGKKGKKRCKEETRMYRLFGSDLESSFEE